MTVVAPVREILASNLRVLRELSGVSQLELAEKVGVSRRTIARLEAGDIADPGVDQVRSLAEALGVTLPVLITERLSLVRIPVPESKKAQLDAAALERMLRAI